MPINDELEITEEGRYSDTASIFLELKQFEKLRALDPPISCADIAQRMAWSRRQTRWLLNRFKDKRK